MARCSARSSRSYSGRHRAGIGHAVAFSKAAVKRRQKFLDRTVVAGFILEEQEIGHPLVESAEMIAARWGIHDKLPHKAEAAKPGFSSEESRCAVRLRMRTVNCANLLGLFFRAPERQLC